MNSENTKLNPFANVMLAIIGFPCLIGGIVLWFFADWVCFLIGMVLAIAGFLMVLYRHWRKASYTMNQAFDNLRFDFNSGLLYLEHRAPVNESPLLLVPLKIDHYQHHNATIEYNSATVGGVTVGGVHVNPAFNTKKTSFSGKYVLMFTDGLKKEEIKEIVLTPALLEIAKQTPKINNLLTADGHIRTQNQVDEATQRHTQQAMQMSSAMGRDDFAFNALSYKRIARGLSHDEAITIISWIKGNF